MKRNLFLLVLGLLVSLLTLNAQSIEPQKILADDGSAFDWFGQSVNISGNYVIVGADGDNDDSGSAYIFYNNEGTWEQMAKLTASDATNDAFFGRSVSISGDYAIVGADGDDDNGIWSGSAYIFYNNFGSWEQTTKLTIPDGNAYDHFGVSVSISGDYAIVGAVWSDENGLNSGSAYIFYNNHGTWEQMEKLIASDGAARDGFGKSVSISKFYAIVGAYEDDDNGNASGSAYIFYNNAGSWEQTEKVIASDGEAIDWFGQSVSISGDYAIVGAYNDDDNGTWSGSAYIFLKNDSGTWEQIEKLTASDAAHGDYFGYSVNISGNYAIVGAHGNSDYGSRSGSAYIFYNIAGTWEQIAKLTAPDAASNDYFGMSVSISDDYVIAGVYRDDDNGTNSGSAYIFDNVESIGISNLSKLGIEIYPNPTTGFFTIETESNFEITISDISGKIIQHLSVDSFLKTIDISAQSSGIYFIKFQNNKTVKTVKIIKE